MVVIVVKVVVAAAAAGTVVIDVVAALIPFIIVCYWLYFLFVLTCICENTLIFLSKSTQRQSDKCMMITAITKTLSLQPFAVTRLFFPIDLPTSPSHHTLSGACPSLLNTRQCSPANTGKRNFTWSLHMNKITCRSACCVSVLKNKNLLLLELLEPPLEYAEHPATPSDGQAVTASTTGRRGTRL